MRPTTGLGLTPPLPDLRSIGITLTQHSHPGRRFPRSPKHSTSKLLIGLLSSTTRDHSMMATAGSRWISLGIDYPANRSFTLLGHYTEWPGRRVPYDHRGPRYA